MIEMEDFVENKVLIGDLKTKGSLLETIAHISL